MVLGTLTHYLEKNKTGPPASTTYKGESKWTNELMQKLGRRFLH